MGAQRHVCYFHHLAPLPSYLDQAAGFAAHRLCAPVYVLHYLVKGAELAVRRLMRREGCSGARRQGRGGGGRSRDQRAPLAGAQNVGHQAHAFAVDARALCCPKPLGASIHLMVKCKCANILAHACAPLHARTFVSVHIRMRANAHIHHLAEHSPAALWVSSMVLLDVNRLNQWEDALILAAELHCRPVYDIKPQVINMSMQAVTCVHACLRAQACASTACPRRQSETRSARSILARS